MSKKYRRNIARPVTPAPPAVSTQTIAAPKAAPKNASTAIPVPTAAAFRRDLTFIGLDYSYRSCLNGYRFLCRSSLIHCRWNAKMDLTAAKTRLITSLRTQIGDERVLSAIASVPRELFIPPQLESLAYSDEPLPIGHNQTISQPYVVAKMTEALELKGPEKVLEIGTGSGYQTAILAKLARFVVSTERIPELSESAARLLKKMGFANIQIEVTGSELGWEAEAPYDAIIVTAATPKVPDSLLRQLATGGRMVIPVGDRDVQELYQITKLKEHNQVRNLGGVRFVPLIADEAWQLR